MTTNQTERVPDEELDQMIWKLERDGMTPKQLSLMRELREVRRAKGEPVAWMYEGEDGREYNGHNEFSGGGKGVPLYAAPSAAVVPDTFMPKNLDRALGVVGVALPESKEEFNFQIERWTQRLIERVIRYADEFQEPPAPVVPDLKELEDILDWILMLPCPTPKATHFAMRLAVVIEACRASMLQSDGTLTNEGTMQPSGNSEQLEPVSNRDELPAKCWCQTCRPVTMNDMRFVVCPECGNKRCPRANDHRNACTGSNAPGQDGSAYPVAKKEVG